MRVRFDKELLEWVEYNEKKFRIELKENAPKHITEKFNHHQKLFEKTVELSTFDLNDKY